MAGDPADDALADTRGRLQLLNRANRSAIADETDHCPTRVRKLQPDRAGGSNASSS
jgi:hypothetical protein